MMRFFLIACLTILAGCRHEEERHDYVSEFRSVDKLVLAQMTVSKMATVDDISLDDAVGMKQTTQALIDKFKIGSRKAAFSYDTYLRAYIDLSQLADRDVTVDHDNRHISIALPPVEVEYAGRDATVREDHYRVTGLRSEIDQKERARIKEMMNTALKTEVETNPEFTRRLEQQARLNAKTYFESLAGRDGYSVSVIFKPRQNSGQ